MARRARFERGQRETGVKFRKGNWRPLEDAADNARRELPLFAEEYWRLGRKANRKGVSAEKLHQFRLATKHWRYLLELFRPLYGPRLEVLLKRLRQVQTILGDLNDYACARRLAESEPWAGTEDSRLLLQYVSAQERKKRREFCRLWADAFDAPGAEQQWIRYLRRYAVSDAVAGAKRKPKTGSAAALS